MKALRTPARLALLMVASVLLAAPAAARDRHGHHGHHDRGDWHDRMENRRDARRAGVVVGVVAAGVAQSAATQQANRRYEDCLQDSAYRNYDPRYGSNPYGYGPDYQWCTQMRYEEERRAQREGRRAGVVAGAIAYGAVRD